ncbi:MAG: DUF1800 family protein [Paracoccus sp. (in: a-proteobacteria)]
MNYAEFAMIRFGTGRSPYHDGPATPEDLMASLRDEEITTRFPAMDGDQARAHLAEFQQIDKAAKGRAKADPPKPDNREARRARRAEKARRERVLYTGLQARLARALDDPIGFADRLTFFWSTHFSMRSGKLNHRYLIEAFQEDVIRRHQYGSFADLLRAATLHPAMLIYLDQSSSVGPRSPRAVRLQTKQRRTVGLNENHARELLELHTLGVGGSYTQDDVRQLAELMTGVTIDKQYRFIFDPKRVEPGAETVLGASYGGARPPDLAELESFLDDLAAHPDTAAFISRKLATHFCADQPPPALVADLTARFKETDGDLMAAYALLASHPLARESFGQKVRQPRDLIIAGLRTMGISGEEVMAWPGKVLRRNYLQPLIRMGQNNLGAPSPEGWPEDAAAWLTPQFLAARIDFAMTTPRQLRKRALPDPRELVHQALAEQAAAEVALVASRAESPVEGIGVILASPQFNRR